MDGLKYVKNPGCLLAGTGLLTKVRGWTSAQAQNAGQDVRVL